MLRKTAFPWRISFSSFNGFHQNDVGSPPQENMPHAVTETPGNAISAFQNPKSMISKMS